MSNQKYKIICAILALIFMTLISVFTYLGVDAILKTERADKAVVKSASASETDEPNKVEIPKSNHNEIYKIDFN